MKNFKNRFGVLVELRTLGLNVVMAKVSATLRLDRLDSKFLAEHVLEQLLPDDILFHSLYDGTFILVPRDEVPFLSNYCVASATRDLLPIVGDWELEDGLLHKVEISLGQSDDCRRDYTVLDTRFIQLRGEVSVEVDDEEAIEE